MRNRIVLIATFLLFFLAANVEAATFQALGDLPGGSTLSSANAISQDGTTIVGYAGSSNGSEAFRWRVETGMVGLGDLPGGLFSSNGTSVSGDGSIVGGTGYYFTERRSFRWTETSGLDVSDIPNIGMSADGTVAVGTFQRTIFPPGGPSESVIEAGKWTETSGFEFLGELAGGRYQSQAYGVSADGNVVVGDSNVIIYPTNPYQGSVAVIWTPSSGPTSLGDLAGGVVASAAYAASCDGSVIVGFGSTAGGARAIRWSASTGLVALVDIPGGSDESSASSVSCDGSVIVGSGTDALGERQAAIWFPGQPGMPIKAYLENNYGLDLTGWTLEQAVDISADGLVITGRGITPDGRMQSWVANLRDEAITCAVTGDISGDGLLNSLDLAPFIACLEADQLEDCQCGDFDMNDQVTTADIPEFVAALIAN